MAQKIRGCGPGGQLNLLLPISGSLSQKGKNRFEIPDSAKIEESRRRLMKDLERTGLRSPEKA